jgi:CheY-like chemotaxis protein
MAEKKIVLVEDKETYRKSLRDILSILGNVEVIGEASNGQEYLELLKTMKPDITFMDIEMPVMNGIEATRRALKIHNDLIIIGLSLYPNEGYIKDMIKTGAKGYLVKTDNNLDLLTNIIERPESEHFFSKAAVGKMDDPNKHKTVLLVEYSESERFLNKSLLIEAGFTVITANSGEEGLKIAKEAKEFIHLVIVDFNLPEMNGVQMLAKIKKISKYVDIQSIILTQEGNNENKILSKAANTSRWMKKPFSLEKFTELAESIF